MLDGFSCKSLSKQNNFAQAFTDRDSKSGEGFAAMMDYVDYARPQVVVTENVGTLAHRRKKFEEVPIDIQQEAFLRRGYRGWYQVLTSNKFGLSQSRTRVWAIYIRCTDTDWLVCLGFDFFFQVH